MEKPLVSRIKKTDHVIPSPKALCPHVDIIVRVQTLKSKSEVQ